MNSISAMPRPQRIEFAGAWYHVLNVSQQSTFTRPVLIKRFIEVLQETVTTYGIGVHSLCVLPNRYDLLVSTPLANLSTSMRHINSVYTQDYNRIQQAEGGLFKGRFKAVLVEPELYALPVSRYIHCLPTQLKRIKAPQDYAWNSVHCYLERKCFAPFIDSNALLAMLAGKDKRRAYRQFLKQGVDDYVAQFYRRKNLRSILSSPGYPRKKDRVNGVHKKLQLKKIANTTADFFKVDKNSLFESMRGPQGGNIPRAVSMLMGREIGHYTLREIAAFFNVDDVSTVSVTIKRLKNKVQDHDQLLKNIKKLKIKLNDTSEQKK